MLHGSVAKPVKRERHNPLNLFGKEDANLFIYRSDQSNSLI
jgi:hypothetical protein